jgi:hypothetical protein
LLLTLRKVPSYSQLLKIVTGKKARFDCIPRDAFISAVAPYAGELVATELFQMYHAFSDIGFGYAGEPEVLKNTEEVILVSKLPLILKLGVHLNNWVDLLKRTGWKGPE